MKLPDFEFESTLWEKGYVVIGVDEVGRGAFAGPIGIGGVVFDPQMSSKKRNRLLSLRINDSKKLTAKKRQELYLHIKKLALAFYTTFINVETINEIGIGKAAFLGMRRVIKNLEFGVKNSESGKKGFFVLVDGLEIPSLNVLQAGIIKGDNLSISIAAASIIAKVERDKLMEKLSSNFKTYGWEKNKGYGTLNHRRAIVKYGLTSFHRPAFCARFVKAGVF